MDWTIPLTLQVLPRTIELLRKAESVLDDMKAQQALGADLASSAAQAKRYCYRAEDRFMAVRSRRRTSAHGRMLTVAKWPCTDCFEESELPISPGSNFKILEIGNP